MCLHISPFPRGSDEGADTSVHVLHSNIHTYHYLGYVIIFFIFILIYYRRTVICERPITHYTRTKGTRKESATRFGICEMKIPLSCPAPWRLQWNGGPTETGIPMWLGTSLEQTVNASVNHDLDYLKQTFV